MKTIKELHQQWKKDIAPAVIGLYGRNDFCALAESWNNFTDAECKAGEITQLQYHYCPAWNEDIPDSEEEQEWLLDRMGVFVSCEWLSSRPDGFMQDMHGGSHWQVTLTRGDISLQCFYSMGRAHKGKPERADVTYNLLLDSSGFEDGLSFEEFCDNYGYDTDSRRAEKIYKACGETARKLDKMFSRDELEQLLAIFEDY